MKKKQSGTGIAGMVIGIIGIVLSCTPIGGVLAVIGLVLSIVGLTQKEKAQGTSVAGLVCSIIAVLIFAVSLFIELPTDSEDGESTTIEIDNRSNFSDSDFEAKEYLFEDTYGDTYLFVVVKNNSDTNAAVYANGVAKDSEGNSVGAGETSIGRFWFEGATGVASVEYELKYSEDYLGTPILKDMSVEQTVNKENVVVSMTYNGEEPVTCMFEGYALFFDEQDNMVGYDIEYLGDYDVKTKPGEKISAQFETYEEFERAETYFSGMAE